MSMQLLETKVVTNSSTSSVIFSNIPQTGRDLFVLVSDRGEDANVFETLLLRFNGSTSDFTNRFVYGTGTSALTSNSQREFGDRPASTSTASTFANSQMLISNYATSGQKAWSTDTIAEQNATAYISWINNGLWNNTAPITSITFQGSLNRFIPQSSISLYIIN